MINNKKAFLFDLNGTMINDMEYHIRAWYRILNELGANISMEKMKEECYGKNHELLERIFPGKKGKTLFFEGVRNDRTDFYIFNSLFICSAFFTSLPALLNYPLLVRPLLTK